MKKTLTIFVFVFISSFINAQEKVITPPLGLSFGMNEVSFKSIMNKYGVYKSTTSQSYGNAVNYDNVKIGSTTASFISGKFVDNKLFEIGAFYFVEDEDIQKKYDEICEIITNKYGKGDEYRTFRNPYEEGDGYFVSAVKGGYTDISTIWIMTNAISVEIDKLPAIKLIYQSTELYKVVEKKMNDKNIDQF